MSTIRRPARRCTHKECYEDAKYRSLCEQHAKQHLQQLHQSRSKQERRDRYGARWQRQRERILDRDGHACVYCGTNERLEVHHIDDTPRPLDAQLVTLCYRHHRAIEAEAKRGQVGKVTRAVAVWIGHTIKGS